MSQKSERCESLSRQLDVVGSHSLSRPATASAFVPVPAAAAAPPTPAGPISPPLSATSEAFQLTEAAAPPPPMSRENSREVRFSAPAPPPAPSSDGVPRSPDASTLPPPPPDPTLKRGLSLKKLMANLPPSPVRSSAPPRGLPSPPPDGTWASQQQQQQLSMADLFQIGSAASPPARPDSPYNPQLSSRSGSPTQYASVPPPAPITPPNISPTTGKLSLNQLLASLNSGSLALRKGYVRIAADQTAAGGYVSRMTDKYGQVIKCAKKADAYLVDVPSGQGPQAITLVCASRRGW